MSTPKGAFKGPAPHPFDGGVTASAVGVKHRASAEVLASRVRHVLKPVIPSELDYSLTATQKGGKLRIELRTMHHEPGWKDTSG